MTSNIQDILLAKIEGAVTNDGRGELNLVETTARLHPRTARSFQAMRGLTTLFTVHTEFSHDALTVRLREAHFLFVEDPLGKWVTDLDKTLSTRQVRAGTDEPYMYTTKIKYDEGERLSNLIEALEHLANVANDSTS